MNDTVTNLSYSAVVLWGLYLTKINQQKTCEYKSSVIIKVHALKLNVLANTWFLGIQLCYIKLNEKKYIYIFNNSNNTTQQFSTLTFNTGTISGQLKQEKNNKKPN